MRGRKISKVARKEIDLVIIAARYQSDGRSLSIAQGYERRGPVWGDVQLFTRETLAEKIDQGKRVVTGRMADIQGDFEVLETVQLQKQNGNFTLFSGEHASNTDQLNIPLF
jgi:hypothetical protein